MKRPPGYSKFNFLILILFLFCGLIISTLWYLHFKGATSFFYGSLIFLTGILTVLLLIFVGGFWGLTVFRKTGNFPRILQKPSIMFVKYFLPLILWIGRLLGLPEDLMQRNIIYMLNMLNCSHNIKVKPAEMLLLVPHCLQNSDCPYHVVHDIRNCRRCGKCQIQDLLPLKEKLGFHMAIVSGGTAARRVVAQIRPKAIVAIACERDLISGIMDIFPYPGIGVINKRPHGPCYNTQVDWDDLEDALNVFLPNQSLGNETSFG